MKAYETRHYLLKAELRWERVEDRSTYPYALPAIAGLHEIEFHPKVTFLVGENGSGKSTLIEALAVAWGSMPKAAHGTSGLARGPPIRLSTRRCGSSRE